MIEDMYSVMQRIHEIRARFGLARRHPAPQVQPAQETQLQGGVQNLAESPQVQGINASWPQGEGEVQQAINYLVGQGIGGSQGPGGLMGRGNQGGQNFFQTLLESIRSDESSENE